MPLELGATFARYRIDGLLGRGGMSDVYRAWDLEGQHAVALKVLRPDNELARDHDQRFLREARVAAKVRHPNAVTVFDFGEAEGIPYIAMELVEGALLTQFLEPGAATLDQKVRWLVEIAGALQAAHDAKLVHRDVKPENVMVRPDGSVKLLDFGVAKRAKTGGGVDVTTTHGGGPTSFKTAAGILVGTPLYMSPEQLLEDPLDGRSDQYCWGLLAYELFTGGTARDPNFHPLRYLTEDPQPLEQVAPDLPPHISATVARALARSRDQRFASMADAASALVGVNVPPPPITARASQPSHPSASGQRHVPTAPPPPDHDAARRLRVVVPMLAGIAVASALISIALRVCGRGHEGGAATTATATAAPTATATATATATPTATATATPTATATATPIPTPTPTPTATAIPSGVGFSQISSADPPLREADVLAKLVARRERVAPCLPPNAPATCSAYLKADGVVRTVSCGTSSAQRQQAKCITTALQGLALGAKRSGPAAYVTFTTELHAP
jgi:serine/threonine-protein kinase